METNNTTSATITYDSIYGSCKYRLPCGYCELKKTECCNWWQTVTMPCKDDWYKVTPTWNPKMNEVTCE